MWTRIELKEKAKMALRKNFWNCVLIAFILGIFAGGGTGTGVSFNFNLNGLEKIVDNFTHSNSYYYDDYYDDYYYDDYYNDYYDDDYYGYYNDNSNLLAQILKNSSFLSTFFTIFAASAFIVLIVIVITTLLQVFLFNPLQVSGCRFFIENSFENPSIEHLLFAFKCGHYKKIVLTVFLKNLYVSLWSLLFVVPGIIKSYEYRMVPYLLADCPDMPREDAFSISKELMNGEKMNAFLLDLSFFGWNLLNACTCGLLGVFWVSPYIHATNAELFLVLKQKYFSGNQYFQM